MALRDFDDEILVLMPSSAMPMLVEMISLELDQRQ